MDFQRFMTPYKLYDSGDGGGSGGDGGQADDGGKGHGALTISSEDQATLKAAGFNPTDFSSQKDLDNAVKLAQKGAHFKGKADQADAEKRRISAEQARQKRDLALTGLVKEDGSVDMEHAKTLVEQAGNADVLTKLVDSLVEHGHLNPNVAEALQADGPVAVLAALKYIPKADAVSKEAFDQAVEARVAERLKEWGVNDGDRANAGARSKPGEGGGGPDMTGLEGFGVYQARSSVSDFMKATDPNQGAK